MSKLRRLGRTDIELSEIGLGCWQFSQGKGLGGSYWPALADDVVREVVSVSIEKGVNWFDTAEMYGDGESEHALARALRTIGKKPGELRVATKWWPMFRTAQSITSTIDTRLACLEGYPIDLYQVHQPWGLSSVEAEMDAMAELVKAGKVRSVGVSNFSASQMRRAHAALAKHGIPLASNQVKYSLIDRHIESNGVMDAAKELGITVIAYSPLEQGILTGRFHDDPSKLRDIKGPRRFRGAFRKGPFERVRPLIDTMRTIAKAHEVTIAQVALRWLLQFHGDTVLVIPGASSARQAGSNAETMAFALGDDELARIDRATRAYL